MYIYIVAVAVAVVLAVILFFALRSTVKRIDYNTKKYFVDKLQDYDYLIEEKQQILDKLNKEIEENKTKISKNTEPEIKIIKENNSRAYQSIGNAKYEDQEIFKNIKILKKNLILIIKKL